MKKKQDREKLINELTKKFNELRKKRPRGFLRLKEARRALKELARLTRELNLSWPERENIVGLKRRSIREICADHNIKIPVPENKYTDEIVWTIIEVFNKSRAYNLYAKHSQEILSKLKLDTIEFLKEQTGDKNMNWSKVRQTVKNLTETQFKKLKKEYAKKNQKVAWPLLWGSRTSAKDIVRASDPQEAIQKSLRKEPSTVRDLSESMNISRADVFKCLEMISREQGINFDFSGDNSNPTIAIRRIQDASVGEFEKIPYYRPYRQVGFLFGTLLGCNHQQMKVIRTIYYTLSQGYQFSERTKPLEIDFMIHAGGAVIGKITPSKKEETFLKGNPDWMLQRDYFVKQWPRLDIPQEKTGQKKLKRFKTYVLQGAEERSFYGKNVHIIRTINEQRNDIIPRQDRFDFFPIGNITLMVINALKGTYRGSYAPGARVQNTVDALMAEVPGLVARNGLPNTPELIVIAGDGKAMDFGSYAGTRVISLPVLNTYFKDNTAEGAPSFGFTWLHVPLEEGETTEKVKVDDIEVHFQDLSELIESVGY